MTTNGITFEVSSRQLWAMVVLVVAAMGGGSSYVGSTANQLQTQVAVLNVTVTNLTDQLRVSESNANSERTQIRNRLDKSDDRIREIERQIHTGVLPEAQRRLERIEAQVFGGKQ